MSRLSGKRYAVVEEWVFHVNMSPGAFRCWVVLRLHANGETAFPSRKLIAGLMHCSTNTVDRALAELQERGLLRVDHHYNDRGDQTANVYRLASGPSPSTGTPSPSTGPPPPHPRGDPLPTHGAPRTNKLNRQEEQQLATLAVAPDPSLRTRNELFDAVALATGHNLDEITTSAGAVLGKVSTALRKVGATPEEVHRRAQLWPLHYPDCRLTPTALEKFWPTLEGPPPGLANGMRSAAMKRMAQTPQAASNMAIEIARERREQRESERS